MWHDVMRPLRDSFGPALKVWVATFCTDLNVLLHLNLYTFCVKWMSQVIAQSWSVRGSRHIERGAKAKSKWISQQQHFSNFIFDCISCSVIPNLPNWPCFEQSLFLLLQFQVFVFCFSLHLKCQWSSGSHPTPSQTLEQGFCSLKKSHWFKQCQIWIFVGSISVTKEFWGNLEFLFSNWRFCAEPVSARFTIHNASCKLFGMHFWSGKQRHFKHLPLCVNLFVKENTNLTRWFGWLDGICVTKTRNVFSDMNNQQCAAKWGVLNPFFGCDTQKNKMGHNVLVQTLWKIENFSINWHSCILVLWKVESKHETKHWQSLNVDDKRPKQTVCKWNWCSWSQTHLKSKRGGSCNCAFVFDSRGSPNKSHHHFSMNATQNQSKWQFQLWCQCIHQTVLIFSLCIHLSFFENPKKLTTFPTQTCMLSISFLFKIVHCKFWLQLLTPAHQHQNKASIFHSQRKLTICQSAKIKINFVGCTIVALQTLWFLWQITKLWVQFPICFWIEQRHRHSCKCQVPNGAFDWREFCKHHVPMLHQFAVTFQDQFGIAFSINDTVNTHTGLAGVSKSQEFMKSVTKSQKTHSIPGSAKTVCVEVVTLNGT